MVEKDSETRFYDDDRTDSFYIAMDETQGVRRDSYHPILICTNGPQQGLRFVLEKHQIILGRSEHADFLINDPGVSRRHLALTYDNFTNPNEQPRCYVQDLGSRNGTQINGEKLTGSIHLNERDRIAIGGTILGFFYRDQEELIHDETLYKSATTDALTGMDNRRQFVSHLRHFIGLAERGRTELSLVMIDLDDFKAVNDTYGHTMGDLVLRHFGKLLKQRKRNSDMAARWGGEEFTLCLPETSLDRAKQFCERIQQDLRENAFAENGDKIVITASFGIALFQPGDTADSLFQRADQLVYNAKNAGKNQICIDEIKEST